jgi:hypothetical protein
MTAFFAIFIGLPVLLIVAFNYKELKSLITRDRPKRKDYEEPAAAPNIAAGIAGSAIAIGSILVDSHNDYQRMLDVDRRR